MSELVDTPEAVSRFLDILSTCRQPAPTLYVDLEGVRLSRHGTISLVQILVPETGIVYLIDVLTLGAKAFSTSSSSTHTTLKTIFESTSITKYFFDVRNDSDALFSLYGVALAGGAGHSAAGACDPEQTEEDAGRTCELHQV